MNDEVTGQRSGSFYSQNQIAFWHKWQIECQVRFLTVKKKRIIPGEIPGKISNIPVIFVVTCVYETWWNLHHVRTNFRMWTEQKNESECHKKHSSNYTGVIRHRFLFSNPLLLSFVFWGTVHDKSITPWPPARRDRYPLRASETSDVRRECLRKVFYILKKDK